MLSVVVSINTMSENNIFEVVLRKQNEILRSDCLIACCFYSLILQIGVRQHQTNAVLGKKTLNAVCVLYCLSAGDDFCAQFMLHAQNIKMNGCKIPCKALAKTEYQNRYQKKSKPGRRSWFKKVRQQFLQ